MAEIIRQRMTAPIDQEFAVLLIGMRANKVWKVHKWVPVARAMARMLKELRTEPNTPLLGYQSWLWNPSIMIQYWRSFEEMEHYAVDKMRAHLPAWAAYNRQVGSGGDVGIWHETYLARPGSYECVYNNMPPFGLAAATKLVPATGGLKTATDRLGLRHGNDA